MSTTTITCTPGGWRNRRPTPITIAVTIGLAAPMWLPAVALGTYGKGLKKSS